tara:strand:- start:118 stop:843 length:726 start_codon:yes stop_codon:yes gene_type:complete
MKNLIAFVAATAMFISLNSASADDHDGGPFYAFYHLQVADPAALIGAMDTFWASDCGKQYPADVALLQEVFNGSSPSTHFIINTFQTSADQQQATEIMRSCPDAVAFLQSLAASGTIPVSQYMGAAPIDESNWTEDTVFSKFDIVVEPHNQARYADAYAKMMMKISRDVDLRSYGLGGVIFGRDKFTHWVWTGARSIPELNAISQRMASHPVVAEFNKDVGRMREVKNTSQNVIIKSYARQ